MAHEPFIHEPHHIAHIAAREYWLASLAWTQLRQCQGTSDEARYWARLWAHHMDRGAARDYWASLGIPLSTLRATPFVQPGSED